MGDDSGVSTMSAVNRTSHDVVFRCTDDRTSVWESEVVEPGGIVGVDCTDIEGEGTSCLPHRVEATRPGSTDVVAAFGHDLCWRGRLFWHAGA
jgi:hypothetical protein